MPLDLVIATLALTLATTLSVLVIRTNRQRRADHAELARLRAQVEDATTAEAIIARADGPPLPPRPQRPHLRLIKGGKTVAVPVALAAWLWHHIRQHSTASATAGIAMVAAVAIAMPAADPYSRDAMTPPVVIQPSATPAASNPQTPDGVERSPAPPGGAAGAPTGTPTAAPPTESPDDAGDGEDGSELCVDVRLVMGTEVCIDEPPTHTTCLRCATTSTRSRCSAITCDRSL